MKINPSFFSIKEKEHLAENDIPLAYITSEHKEYEVKIALENQANEPYTKRPLTPFEEFDRPDPIIFDNNANEIKMIDHLKRVNNKWQFTPKDMVEFLPEEFSFHVVFKRNQPYNAQHTYNLKVGVVDEDGQLSKTLINVFGDSARRLVSPMNVLVNNGDTNVESLSNSSVDENDFVFIESRDGVHYFSDTNSVIDFDAYLENHTNVWLSVDSFEDVITKRDDEGMQYSLTDQEVYKTLSYLIPEYNYHFDENEEHSAFPSNDFPVIDYFAEFVPILIYHKPNKGYVIVSQKEFLNHAFVNNQLLFEILLRIYNQSYFKTSIKNSWITDENIDYAYSSTSIFGGHHKNYFLNSLLAELDEGTVDNNSLISVEIDSGQVKYSGARYDGRLNFIKDEGSQDPAKSSNSISIYTNNGTVVYYASNFYYVHNPLQIVYVEKDSTVQVSIEPIVSTPLGIHTKRTNFDVSKKSGTYVISGLDNTLFCNSKDDYIEMIHGVKIATVQVIEIAKVKKYDTRVRGGGVPFKENGSFDCLDIGHVNGRPLRIGSGSLIRLPKRFKPYHKQIINEVHKHAAASEQIEIKYE